MYCKAIALLFAGLMVAVPTAYAGHGQGAATGEQHMHMREMQMHMGGQHVSSANGNASDQAAEKLPPVTVRGDALGSLTVPTTAQARRKLDRVPGNTSVVDDSAIRSGSTGNLEDTVAFVPGVYAQGRAGPETHLSVRGSGISIPWVIKGVRLLRNGIPLNEADGWYHSQLIEPLTIQHVEVYPGANALQYGAATLGGAINFVPYTGYTADPLSVSVETGSRNYFHPQVASGQVLAGGWDYYASLSGLYADGWRDHQATNSTMFYGNLGHRDGGNSETRVHLALSNSKQQLPGALTRAQLEDDPTQANDGTAGPCFNPLACADDVIPFAGGISYANAGAENEFNRYRLAVQHTFYYGDGNRLEGSLFAAYQTVHHPLPFVVIEKHFQNYGTSLRGVNHFPLFGHANRLVWGAVVMFGHDSIEDYAPTAAPGPDKGALQDTKHMNALTTQLYVEDHFALLQSLDLVVGTQLAYSKRRSEIAHQPSAPDVTLDESYYGFNPRLGLVWQATKTMQVFGNVSRSFEPPVFYEFNNAFLLSSDHTVLDAQTGTTVEVGTRGTTDLWHWQLAAYRSWVDDEILSFAPPGGQARPFNANNTIHFGVGLGLDGHIPLHLLGGDDLHLRLAYTYSNFRFDDSSKFGNNELPGIPEHFARVALLYETGTGFYIGPTLAVASSYYVDYANTLRAHSYTILGARAGYKTDRWTLYVEGINLTDKHYAASSEVKVNVHGQDGLYFQPGRPVTVMLGIRVNW